MLLAALQQTSLHLLQPPVQIQNERSSQTLGINAHCLTEKIESALFKPKEGLKAMAQAALRLDAYPAAQQLAVLLELDLLLLDWLCWAVMFQT